MPQPIEKSELLGLLEAWETSNGLSYEISDAFDCCAKEAYDLTEMSEDQLVDFRRTIINGPEYDRCMAVVLVLKAVAQFQPTTRRQASSDTSI